MDVVNLRVGYILFLYLNIFEKSRHGKQHLGINIIIQKEEVRMKVKKQKKSKKNQQKRRNIMKDLSKINQLTSKDITNLTGLTEKEIKSLHRGEIYKIDYEGQLGNLFSWFEYRENLLIIRTFIVQGKDGNKYTLYLQEGIIIYSKDFDYKKYINTEDMFSGTGSDFSSFVRLTIQQIPKELMGLNSKFIDVNLFR